MLTAFRPIALVALFLAAAGCGEKRTSAATQTTPAAFNPASSDAEAVAAVDKMLTALGGHATWDAAKQIQFEQRYMLDGKLQGIFRHAWDKWNGRHRFEHVDMSTVAKAEAEGNPGLVRSLVVMYDLFNRDKGHVTYGGQVQPSDVRTQRIGEAYERWKEDVYKVTFPYKLKDPGVVLKLRDQVMDQSGTCKKGCQVVEVQFADGVGTDTYEVWIDSETSMPAVMRKKMEGGWLGFGFQSWTETGGLKFAEKLQNLGVDGEVFQYGGIEVGEPDDSLYIPTVH
jgi:hypothetical protein